MWAIQKVNSVYFRHLMYEQGRAHTCKVAHMTHCLLNHHITGHLVFVLFSTECIMMCPVIENAASCEIRAVTYLPCAKT
jgi:hypothetical protein